jgi:hypothetical protein
MEMYDLMKSLFPLVHSVIAITVSSERKRGEQVDLSSFFDVDDDNEGDSDDCGVDRDDVGISVDDDVVVPGSVCDVMGNCDDFGILDCDEQDDADIQHEHELLTKRERAILEFFIAKLRLRSRKKMRFWAMIPPLANNSMGHNKLPPDHPLHGSGCSLEVVWRRLNELFESTIQAHFDLITSQQTISMAFDNWQVSIGKMWQSYGCSNTFLRGVASFMKKNKAVLLPVGCLVRSPSGAIFAVTSSKFLDCDSVIVSGRVVGGRQSSTEEGVIGLFARPSTGWKRRGLRMRWMQQYPMEVPCRPVLRQSAIVM